MNDKVKFRYSFLKILTGSDLAQRRIPVMSAESKNQGPTVWITACGHGDEVGGMVVIQEIFKIIKRTGLPAGTIKAIPLMNPIGFENVTRNITHSKEDLNRSFPGNEKGSLAERIAFKIYNTIISSQPDLVIDLHNDWINSIPYTLIDPVTGDSEIYEKTLQYGEQAGFYQVSDSEVLKKALSFNLMQSRIPSLTIELGESYIVNEKNVQYGIQAVINILTFMGICIDNTAENSFVLPEAFRNKLLNYSDKPYCSSTGIIRFNAKAGDQVKKGQVIAKVYNTFGKKIENIYAINNGIVLGRTDSSVALPGNPVMAFGNL